MRFVTLLLALLLVLPALDARATRIKDIAHVEGVRPNQLIGYGLVVGLDGTGDSRRATMTVQSLAAMLSRMGVRIDPEQLHLRNVAAVMVTATLPPFSQPGSSVDVVVSSIGNARSLFGGTLLLTPLKGLDGRTYAVAQGPLQVGGYGAEGLSGTRFQKNHLNVGRIPSGALVEQTVPVALGEGEYLMIQVNDPDFTTANAVATAINNAGGALGGGASMAVALTSGEVRVTVPAAARANVASFIGKVEVLEVTPDTAAKVVLNSRTGTVVMGENVRISTVAVAHGALTIEVNEAPAVSQPLAPFTGGTTQVVPQSGVAVTEQGDAMKLVQAGATLGDIVRALNTLGATPRDLIDILQAIKAAGALHAELEVL
jgi:flagellar P-ring protein precursor FlgI